MAKKEIRIASSSEMSAINSSLNEIGSKIDSLAGGGNLANIQSALNTVNADVNTLKSNVSNIATNVAKAGDYILSPPKRLITNGKLTGFPSGSPYSSSIVTITGEGFVVFNHQYIYNYQLYDLTIDNVVIADPRYNTAHKWSNLTISNIMLKPIYFQKSISFGIGYASANTDGGVIYQVGLK